MNNNTLFIKLVEYPIINEIIIVGETTKKFKEQIKKQKELLEDFRKIESEKSSPIMKSFFEKAKKFWNNS